MKKDSAACALRTFAAMLAVVWPGLAPAQGWSQRTTIQAPSARAGHALAADWTRGFAVLFGGRDTNGNALADTAEWNGFGWSARNASGPSARSGHGLVYDNHRSRIVLFGGLDAANAPLGDTWEWDGSQWQQRSTANAPSPRSGHGMCYDSWRRQTLVFGGEDPSASLLADTWAYDGAAWTPVSPGAAILPRRDAAMAFDSVRGKAVLFGGGSGVKTFGDTWTLDGANWQQESPISSPGARWQARLSFDERCGTVLLHGGGNAQGTTTFGDTWIWDGSDWSRSLATALPARRQGGLCYDARRGRMVAFGGSGPGGGPRGSHADTGERAGECARTMTLVTPPMQSQTAAWRYNYPPAAAGHYGIHLLTLSQPGSFYVPIPGFTSLGDCRVDLFSVGVQLAGFLDASGSAAITVPIPADPALSGLAIDVQSVDIAWLQRTIFWADNDVESVIAPMTPPVASFVASPSSGQPPLAVQFTDTSTGNPTSWQWDFEDDGVVDSTQQNPTWTYAAAGSYSVRLVVSNAGGSDSVVQQSAVQVGQVPNPALNMVAIQPGTFQMGSTAGGTNEQPVHAVTITQPFWCGKYEVTQAEYQAVVGSNPSYFQGASYPNAGQRPVEGVSWNDAMAYCAALTANEAAAGRIPAGYQYRLPTEAEWEYCCRAGTTTEWNTGANLGCAQANFGILGSECPTNPGETIVVGSYAANPWGLYDTHGNVWEWCLDSWDFTANYPSSAVSDPYVSSGPLRVYRGGNWGHDSGSCRAAYRSGYYPGSTSVFIGFRVVLAPVLVP